MRKNKYKAGDKFILEIDKDIAIRFDDPGAYVYKAKGLDRHCFSEQNLDKLPQIPDCQAVFGKVYTDDEIKDKEAVAYYNGLSEAWDAVRKIIIPPNYGWFSGSLMDNDLDEIFGTTNTYKILMKTSAEEAIRRISDYEEKKKEKMFCVGDVIQSKDNPEVIAVVTFVESGGIFDAIKISESDKWGPKYDLFFKRPMSFWEKTGEHFDLDELFRVSQKAGRR